MAFNKAVQEYDKNSNPQGPENSKQGEKELINGDKNSHT